MLHPYEQLQHILALIIRKRKEKNDILIAFFSEMIEHVGHEYMEEFFGCCESLLAEDGLFVLQVIKQMMSYIFFPLL